MSDEPTLADDIQALVTIPACHFCGHVPDSNHLIFESDISNAMICNQCIHILAYRVHEMTTRPEGVTLQ